MKKKLLLAIPMMMSIAFAGKIDSAADLSKLSADNIEALANGEGGGNWTTGEEVGSKKIVIKEAYTEWVHSPGGGFIPVRIPAEKIDIRCCVPSVQANACDHTTTDSRC